MAGLGIATSCLINTWIPASLYYPPKAYPDWYRRAVEDHLFSTLYATQGEKERVLGLALPALLSSGPESRNPTLLSYPGFLVWILLPRISKPDSTREGWEGGCATCLVSSMLAKLEGVGAIKASEALCSLQNFIKYTPCFFLCPLEWRAVIKEEEVFFTGSNWRCEEKCGLFLGFRTQWHVDFLWWEGQGDCTDSYPAKISVEQMVRKPIRPM